MVRPTVTLFRDPQVPKGLKDPQEKRVLKGTAVTLDKKVIKVPMEPMLHLDQLDPLGPLDYPVKQELQAPRVLRVL